MARVRAFEDIAEAEGWTSHEQVSILLDYIGNQDDDGALAEYAEERAAADHEDPEEDEAYERAAAKARSNDFEDTGEKDWT